LQYYGFWQGFGHQTKEGAQYRALILGMRQAIMKGFKHVTVKGDSEFVVNQVCFIDYALLLYLIYFSLLHLKMAFEC
jgi:ribonuclease HI